MLVLESHTSWEHISHGDVASCPAEKKFELFQTIEKQTMTIL